MPINELTAMNHTSEAELPALIAGAGSRACTSLPRISSPSTSATENKRPGKIISCRMCNPVHVAAYIKQLQGERAGLPVKQHLALARSASCFCQGGV